MISDDRMVFLEKFGLGLDFSEIRDKKAFITPNSPSIFNPHGRDFLSYVKVPQHLSPA